MDEPESPAPPGPVVAVADLGSNSLRLLAAASDGRSVVPLAEQSERLRLGADIARLGRISDENIARSVEVVRGFVEIATGLGAPPPLLVATEAIRAAANSADFVTALEAATGQPLQVLTHAREALL